MQWHPRDYSDISTIRIPPDKLWLPDIVLFNNADGNYEVSYHSNVVVKSSGEMLWVPPAIYKSSCIIDVEHFPFDEQKCKMNFGSWTFNEREVILDYNKGIRAVDLREFYDSTIWDIVECPAYLNGPRNRLWYFLILRRKALFYTVVLIIPTVLMAFLSMMVFYLPADAGEKITLAISILLSLVVFLLLVSKILPATSSTIPLMAKYLLLTFVLNVITIMVTVIIINLFYRGPATHRMPRWARIVFLDILSCLLVMRRPKKPPGILHHFKDDNTAVMSVVEDHFHVGASLVPQFYDSQLHIPILTAPTLDKLARMNHMPDCPFAQQTAQREIAGINFEHAVEADQDLLRHQWATVPYTLSPEILKAISAIEYITQHLKAKNEFKTVREDWKYVALVIDRLLLYIFFGVTLGGTLGILFSAPNIFDHVDQRSIIAWLKVKYGWGD